MKLKNIGETGRVLWQEYGILNSPFRNQHPYLRVCNTFDLLNFVSGFFWDYESEAENQLVDGSQPNNIIIYAVDFEVYLPETI